MKTLTAKFYNMIKMFLRTDPGGGMTRFVSDTVNAAVALTLLSASLYFSKRGAY